MNNRHFKLVNVLAAESNTLAPKEENCGEYKDAPVCTNGERDVQNPVCATTMDRYRGCTTAQTDCANCPTQADNQDDQCCRGAMGNVGDNIDHAFCHFQDASWGGISLCFWYVRDSNQPPAY